MALQSKIDEKKRNQASKSLTPKKRLLFFLVTVLFPFVFLFAFELILRAVSYGPNLSLFTTEQIAGKTYHIMNPDVKSRYFSRVQFSPNTSLDYFLMPKLPGVYRIFCLGGSTTIGFPYGPAGSFPSFLRDRLKRIFPHKSFQIINLGMTATNSYTVIDMARELVSYEPDLLIVYDGHNEFYGALGIASRESLGGSRLLTKIYLQLIHLRTFLFLKNVLASIRGVFVTTGNNQPSGTMMERMARGQNVPFQSVIYRRGLKIFEENLDELKEICSANQIPLIISSQVSNLRDQPPFVSAFQGSISESQRAQFNRYYAQGVSYWDKEQTDSALVEFRNAASIDSMRADVRYQIARCLDSMAMKREARLEYIAARDYDQLRFRTSSDFNNAVKRLGEYPGVFVVDIERAFSDYSQDSIIGRNLILEHLHPNLHGYFLMAKACCQLMHANNLFATQQDWSQADTVTDEPLWENHAITEIDKRAAQERITLLISSWPFKSRELPVTSPIFSDTIGRIVHLLMKGQITWEESHVAAAEYYEAAGNHDKAAAEYRTLISQLPLNVSAYLRLAQVCLRMKKNQEAKKMLLQSLNIEKTFFAYQILGEITLEYENTENAIPYLERAYAFSQTIDERSDAGYVLAVAYVRAAKPDRAIAPLEHILQMKPQLQEARALLNRLTAQKK